jgi:hypothetical protein
MAKWDAGRFLNTVSYFEAIPIVSDLRRLLTGGVSSQATENNGGRSVGVVLVIGATSEIGELVMRQLVKSGYRVRALLSDLNLAPFSVPTNVEFVEANLDRADSLTPLLRGVRSIVVCPDPHNELNSATLHDFTTTAAAQLPAATTLQLFDFTQPNVDLHATWGAVDDVVMGGVSESGIRLMSGYALFSGNVSIDNSGGFASVRTRNFDPSLDLSNYHGIELRIKGDGQRYKIFVRTEATWDGVGYAYSFDTKPDEWMTVRVPFRDLVPIFRAKTVKDAQPIDLSQIRSFQLMLSKFEYDRQLNPHFNPGLFSLQIESISAYDGRVTPQLVVVDTSERTAAVTATLQASSLPYSIVKAETLEAQMVALICVKALTQPETVGRVLGR